MQVFSEYIDDQLVSRQTDWPIETDRPKKIPGLEEIEYDQDSGWLQCIESTTYFEFIVLYKVFLKYFCYVFFAFLVAHSCNPSLIHLFFHPSIMPKNRLKPETSGDADRGPLFRLRSTVGLIRLRDSLPRQFLLDGLI